MVIIRKDKQCYQTDNILKYEWSSSCFLWILRCMSNGGWLESSLRNLQESQKSWVKPLSFRSHFTFKLTLILVHRLSPVTDCSGCYNKFPRLRGLISGHLFLTVPEAGKSEIMTPADTVFGETSFLGLWMAAFSLCPHVLERKGQCLFLIL